MAVTHLELATDIKEAISFPLRDMFGGPLDVDALRHLAIEKFRDELSEAVAKAITKAIREGVVG